MEYPGNIPSKMWKTGNLASRVRDQNSATAWGRVLQKAHKSPPSGDYDNRTVHLLQKRTDAKLVTANVAVKVRRG
jgi:hypothetical protein